MAERLRELIGKKIAILRFKYSYKKGVWMVRTMPPDSLKDPAVLPGPRTRGTKGEKYPRAHISRAEANNRAWLSWKTHGCEHGLKSHKVNPDGTIEEIEDSDPEPRRKPKSISQRQWGEAVS